MDSSAPNTFGGWGQRYDSWSRMKSDESLVEAWRLGDKVEKDLAGLILSERYGGKLKGYVSRKLPADWVESTVQQIWEEFYTYVENHVIVSTVAALLFGLGGIAHNVRADAVERLTQERQLESGELARATLRSVAEEVEGIEELLVNRKQLAFLECLPFADRLLSDCQWVLWRLRKNLGYSTDVVARLLGKPETVIYSSLSAAKTRLKSYIRGDQFSVSVAMEGSHNGTSNGKAEHSQHGGCSIEWFSKPTVPRLTPGELRPLGLSAEELGSDYRVSLWLPDSSCPGTMPSQSELMLLLTNRKDWKEAQKNYRTLQRKALGLRGNILPTATEDWRINPLPEGSTYLVVVTVEDDNIILKPEGMVRFNFWMGRPKNRQANKSEEGVATLRVHSPRLAMETIVSTHARGIMKHELIYDPDVPDAGFFHEWHRWQQGDRTFLPGEDFFIYIP